MYSEIYLGSTNFSVYVHLELELAATNATVVDFKLKTVVKGKAFRFGAWITQIDCYSFNVLKGLSFLRSS